MADTQQKAYSSGLLSSRAGSNRRWGDYIVQLLFAACALLIIVIIIGVFAFVGQEGLKLFVLDPDHAGSLLTGTRWDPPAYGALGFILGSIVTTLVSTLIVAPLAIGMALFMTELCPRWLERILRPLLEVFTGMPSVVIGFLGLVVLVPWIGHLAAPLAPGQNASIAGYGWGTAIVILVMMVLPTVTSIAIDTLRAVPTSIREASLALGSTRWQMMKRALIPAAIPGLATAIVLGMGRAIGETFAVSMVLKGATSIPDHLLSLSAFFQPNTSLTNAILSTFGEASEDSTRSAIMMLGFILLIISFLFVCLSRYLASRSVYR